jgi:hypothetical protein
MKNVFQESKKMKAITLVSAICAAVLMTGSVATAANITLTGVVRDFLPDGQEFERPIDGLRTGIVLPTLGVDNKPVYHPGSSDILVAAVRHHFELAAVEQDSQAIVCEVSKSSGC